VLTFEIIDKPKTCANVCDWMAESFVEASLTNQDINQLAADGASNAIGSTAEYELLTQPTRSNDVELSVCNAHQNEWLGGYAVGMIAFAVPANQELGDILDKSHGIQVGLSRSSIRMAIYHDIQVKNKHKPILVPGPTNKTRWNGTIDETIRANTIMGDVYESLDILLGEGGDDRAKLVNKTMAESTYTDNDKMVLQQFEGAAVPAKVYSKFTQDTKETRSYVLYESKLAIASSRKDTFTIQPGKYPQLHIVGCIKMCEQNNRNNVTDNSIICADCRCFSHDQDN
jgi:hypothetical protein